jgi:hypothetical protein
MYSRDFITTLSSVDTLDEKRLWKKLTKNTGGLSSSRTSPIGFNLVYPAT